ncbi:MAG TPA: maltose alpha-D-glucosyltransferase [Steroidobacteraceae bacterium]|nr:maltose alpha-D-glucosyltransferase [Steroidobacteraceae bacterium]
MSAPLEPLPFAGDPLWYKDAIIYEVHVRAFFDSNDDGIGDFPGITRKLDYIQELGVNTIWLLPFYPSPGRDDGYDIADYHNIHPQYGTRREFRNFVREAHRRGLRVITELVINHTSDAHPWFQAARRAPAGSAKRNFYVWSDSADRYAGTRIIFRDTESSNWSWDPLAKAYYWHRFFGHQPDLNFDNPHVVRAVTRIMEFWLGYGVDGFRLDAIPYLVEREGTNNENLRETHDIVKRIRRVISAKHPDRMLLAEANQWPEDVRDYFGDGDECHMAYHFPLMPRMYMAIAQEDRHPIVEIMEQTPDIPDNCQWAVFLRNHDELTLEMVTSRERDYMYQAYAADTRARLNLGIRRRLAPLMENDPERIKLMNSLLLSMPGSPIIYYGDEIGMGDNFYLGDRNGVRTPMQWSPDRNAGFSRADPQQLYLPPIMDPIYGYEAVNVEAQTRDRSSLLNWMRRMLAVRKSSQAFGRGTLRFIRPGNRKVLVYLRQYAEDTILCVVNLSRSAQPAEIDLSEHKGTIPVELLGRSVFPPVGELPYLLTLPAYGFYWFRLSREAAPPSWHDERLPREDLPVLVLVEGWNSFFPDRVAAWRAGLATRLRSQLETRIVPQYLAQQRWFAGKGAPITSVRLLDHAERQDPLPRWFAGIYSVETRGQSEGNTDRYFVPLAIAFEDTEEARWRKLQPAALARVRQQSTVGVLADACADEGFARAIIDAIGASAELPTREGRVRFTPTTLYPELRGDPAAELAVSPTGAQSSNTTLRVGDGLFLKFYRKLQPGVNPELEIGRYLTEVARFPNIVPVAGAAEYTDRDAVGYTVALLQAYVPNQGDGWSYTVDYLVRFLEDRRSGVPVLDDAHGLYLSLVRTLAIRTAELHRSLARPSDDPAFAPEPIEPEDVAGWAEAARAAAETTLSLLSERISQLPSSIAADAQTLIARREKLLQLIASCAAVAPSGLKIRRHGDYHLGQVLLKRNDFVIVDFEGEPGRTLAERRRKHSPLTDVAGMLRSFAYARQAALERCALQGGDDCGRWEPQLQSWEQEARRTFLASYDEVASAAALYGSLEQMRPLLNLFEIDKALYEVRYELGNRPEWTRIPLHSLLGLSH